MSIAMWLLSLHELHKRTKANAALASTVSKLSKLRSIRILVRLSRRLNPKNSLMHLLQQDRILSSALFTKLFGSKQKKNKHNK